MSLAAHPRPRGRTALFVAVAALLTVSTALAADDEKKDKQNKLPIRNVVLFNSGVGFFEHRDEVEGDAEIALKFNVEDINDLLKSMVLQDLGGGKISTVTYTSKDPITKTLKTFAIDLTNNPTLAQILGQARGEKVEIEAPDKLLGTIIGVETRKHKPKKNDDEVIEIDVLNLLTERGLKSLPLEQVSSIKFVDEKLDNEFRQALALLATSHSTDKKTVTLRFAGQGKRPVRVGYVQESPIWKTSYRLVLNKEGSPLLQGWAIVENTTEEDWNDVQLTLVSGRPISFVMDLYEPLYVKRPRVEPELFASLRPQKYDQDLAANEQQFRDSAARGRRKQQLGVGMGGGMAAEAAPGRAAYSANAPAPAAPPQADEFSAAALDIQQGVEASAQAGDVGELFQYAIDTPVTLERQRSAMLPIVNGPVEAKKISIYSPGGNPKHPLNGLKLKNSTELHLMQGPITVFDGGAYAGDAQIDDLPPGADRLVSYALDLDVEVAQETESQAEQLTSLKLIKGVLQVTTKLRRKVNYTVKNSGDAAKTVLIEYPFDPNWKLIEPKEPTEKTRDTYRFEVQAEPGKPAKLAIVEEMITTQSLAVSNLDQSLIEYYRGRSEASEDVKKALAEIVKRRQQIEAVAVERQQKDAEIQAITQEQLRIRDNMAQLDRVSELYKKYEAKLNTQESQFDDLRKSIKSLTEQETKLRQDLERYIVGLDLGK